MKYEVIVGNIGRVTPERCGPEEAEAIYSAYVERSRSDIGLAAGEPVTLMGDDEILREYTPITGEADGPLVNESEAIVAKTPDQIDYFRLASLKAALRLEGVGMRRSRGKSARSLAEKEFGVKGIPACIEAIKEKMASMLPPAKPTIYCDRRGLRIGTLDSKGQMYFAIPGRYDTCPESATERVDLIDMDHELNVYNILGAEQYEVTYADPRWKRACSHLLSKYSEHIPLARSWA